MEKQYYFQTKHMTVGYGGVPSDTKCGNRTKAGRDSDIDIA